MSDSTGVPCSGLPDLHPDRPPLVETAEVTRLLALTLAGAGA